MFFVFCCRLWIYLFWRFPDLFLFGICVLWLCFIFSRFYHLYFSIKGDSRGVHDAVWWGFLSKHSEMRRRVVICDLYGAARLVTVCKCDEMGEPIAVLITISTAFVLLR